MRLFFRKLARKLSPKYVTIEIEVSKEIWDYLNKEARENNILIDEVVERLCREYLNKVS